MQSTQLASRARGRGDQAVVPEGQRETVRSGQRADERGGAKQRKRQLREPTAVRLRTAGVMGSECQSEQEGL